MVNNIIIVLIEAEQLTLKIYLYSNTLSHKLYLIALELSSELFLRSKCSNSN